MVCGVLRKRGIRHFVGDGSVLTRRYKLGRFLVRGKVSIIRDSLKREVLRLVRGGPDRVIIPTVRVGGRRVNRLFIGRVNARPNGGSRACLARTTHGGLHRGFVRTRTTVANTGFTITSANRFIIYAGRNGTSVNASRPGLRVTTFKLRGVIPSHRTLNMFAHLLTHSNAKRPVAACASRCHGPHGKNRLRVVVMSGKHDGVLTSRRRMGALGYLQYKTYVGAYPICHHSNKCSCACFVPNPVNVGLKVLGTPLRCCSGMSTYSLYCSYRGIYPTGMSLTSRVCH